MNESEQLCIKTSSSIENHQDYIHVKEKELRNELINFSKI